MATVANQYDPNNPNSNQGGGGQVLNSTAGGTSTAGGAGSAFAGGGSGSGVSNTARTPTGAPNVQQYLNANQGAGQQLSQGIQSNVQNQANQVQQGIQNAQNQFNTTGLGNLNEANEANTIGQVYNQAGTSFQSPQALLDQFQQLQSGGYNPAIQNYSQNQQQQYGQLQNQAQQIGQQATNSANELGRGQLLQQTINQPGYSQGQQTLDQLFLQGQAQPLQHALSGIAGTTNQNVNAANQAQQAQVQALQNLSSQGQSAIQDLFTQGNGASNASSNPVLSQALQNVATGGNGLGLNQIQQNAQNALTQAQTQGANLKSQLYDANGNPTTAFQQGNLTPEQLQSLGLGSMAGQQTWGADISAGAQMNTPDITTVTNPTDIARYNALNQLAGGGAGKTVEASPFSTSETAGSYTGPISMNPQTIQNAIQARQQALQGDFTSSLSGFQAGNTPELQSLIAQMRSSNPDQAKQISQNFINGIPGNSAAPGMGGMGNSATTPRSDVINYINQQLNPFNNFYNQTYAPAEAARLGQATPDQNPLLANWPTSVTAPQGK